MNLKIISTDLLEAYFEQVDQNLQVKFEALQDAPISTDTFSFYTSVASVFSSKIEGEEIDLDSYVKHKKFGVSFSPDYTRKIDDLYDAYRYAQTHALNREHISEAHRLLSRHLLAPHHQGKLRTQNMYVSTSDGKIEYVAVSPFDLLQEMEKFYHDLEVLIGAEMSLPEVFYFAAQLHLVFVKIHPWTDGNGRTARLIEKWFLSQKLGPQAWYVQSEKHYYRNHMGYYNAIRALGLEYEQLDYGKSLPFLRMLMEAVGEG